MPLYEFRCPEGTTFEAQFSMATVPQSLPCPECDGAATRRISTVRLSRANSPEARLIDSTQRSAEAPEVVSSVPGRSSSPGRSARPTHTSNPLHQRLPRP